MTGDFDPLYQRAVGILILSGRASTSYLHRELAVPYNDAARLMERAEIEKIVSMPNAVGKRDVLIHRIDPQKDA